MSFSSKVGKSMILTELGVVAKKSMKENNVEKVRALFDLDDIRPR